MGRSTDEFQNLLFLMIIKLLLWFLVLAWEMKVTFKGQHLVLDFNQLLVQAQQNWLLLSSPCCYEESHAILLQLNLLKHFQGATPHMCILPTHLWGYKGKDNDGKISQEGAIIRCKWQEVFFSAVPTFLQRNNIIVPQRNVVFGGYSWCIIAEPYLTWHNFMSHQCKLAQWPPVHSSARKPYFRF